MIKKLVLSNFETFEDYINAVILKIKNKIIITKESEFKKWLLTKKDFAPFGKYFDVLTLYNCFIIQDKINNEDSDYLDIFCGKEGSGKSTINLQKCCFIDPTFDNTRIFYEPETLFEWLSEHKGTTKGKSIQLDEGAQFLFSREGNSKESKLMVKLLTLIRQANLHIGLCIPDYRLIDSYIRRHRVNSVSYITKQKVQFKVFNTETSLSKLNYLIKKNVSPSRISSEDCYFGWWTNNLPNKIQEGLYRELKLNKLHEFLTEGNKILKDKHKVEEVKNISDMQPLSKASAIMNLDTRTLIKRTKEGTLESERIGKKIYIKIPSSFTQMYPNDVKSKVFVSSKQYNDNEHNIYNQMREDLK